MPSPKKIPNPAGARWPLVKDKGVVRVVFYRRGARVFHETSAECKQVGRAEDSVILDQSSKSRHRAALAFGNAECDWFAMSVLTWRAAPEPEEVKSAIKFLRRAWLERWGESMDAWLMEMQARGVPHFHLFHAKESSFGAACQRGSCEMVTRKGKRVALIRGGADFWLRDVWRRATKDDSEASRAFNAGGILEAMRSSDAAGRYVAKECSKRAQKLLPDRYSEGLGRWWWLNPRWTPIPEGEHFARLDPEVWPWDSPYAMVWDKAALSKAMLSPDEALVERASRRNARRELVESKCTPPIVELSESEDAWQRKKRADCRNDESYREACEQAAKL